MISKKRIFTNFSHTNFSPANCFRPDNEEELKEYILSHPTANILIRGSGLSYNDSCFNSNGIIIDSTHLNHFINFDSQSGIVICQGGVLLKDLFLVHPNYIPPVLPGTVHGTVAGAIAHDVHGKNNHQEGSFGYHLIGLDLLVGNKKICCSRHQNKRLFYATIGGLGLTGVILRAKIRLKKRSRFVLATHQKFTSIHTLMKHMASEGLSHDYQVAWLDLLNSTPCGIISTADYCASFHSKKPKSHKVPPIPFSLIKAWNIKLFNHYFFNYKKPQKQSTLEQFNNPLDKLIHWNRLYGPQGLIQFQAIFNLENAKTTFEHLLELIQRQKATPILAVLKLFTKSGEGLLSFCKPGFALAIDFIHNDQARRAIYSMNQFIAECNGRVYLAKDLLLNKEQYQKMYEHHTQLSQIMEQYGCTMLSDLSKRLGIKK